MMATMDGKQMRKSERLRYSAKSVFVTTDKNSRWFLSGTRRPANTVRLNVTT